MCRYYFDLVDCELHCIDDEGADCPDLATARLHAIRGIRDVLSSSVRAGSLCLKGHVSVRDPAGKPVLIVPFDEAVSLV